MKREKWIDNAKGIAILLVIIGHTGSGLQGIFNFSFVHGFHLVVFFILSGYTLKKERITREYLNRKFSRLMTPYFYTCFAILIADIIKSGLISHDFTIRNVTGLISRDLTRGFFASGTITSFGQIEIGTRIGAIWFLPALFFAILIVQLVLGFCEGEDKKQLAWIVLCFIAVLGYISARFIWLPFSIQSGMIAALFIYLGYRIRETSILHKLKWFHYVIALVILLLGIRLGYCGIYFVRADMKDLVLSIPVGLAGGLLVYGVSILYRGRLLQWMGQRSLMILCAHLFALETMGNFFQKMIPVQALSENGVIWIGMAIHVLFAVLVGAGIDYLKRPIKAYQSALFQRYKAKRLEEKRDISVDVAKGIFIISMIVGHMDIDATLRTIIFSCHMIAFVFLSGYFYNRERKISETIRRMIHSLLLPYLLFVMAKLLLNVHQWNGEYIKSVLIQYLLGMSFSRNIITWSTSVGPVYFILLLFVVRALYLLIDRFIRKESVRWALILCISITGVLLGQKGYWLPWSSDVACYSLVYYKLGHVFREKNLLRKVKVNHIVYFLSTPVWVFMIYSGGMEIAIRNYGGYGLVIIGSLMGVLVVLKLADYIGHNLPVTCTFLRIAGQASIIVLIIHTLFNGEIRRWLSTYLSPESAWVMLISVMLQVGMAIILKLIMSYINYARKKSPLLS